jgi:hypothetical protein
MVAPRFHDPLNQRVALSASKQYWSTVMCLPVALYIAWLVSESPAARHVWIYSDRYMFETASSHVWSSNDDLTTVPHTYARAGTYYVTRKWSQGLLNCGASLVLVNERAWNFSSTLFVKEHLNSIFKVVGWKFGFNFRPMYFWSPWRLLSGNFIVQVTWLLPNCLLLRKGTLADDEPNVFVLSVSWFANPWGGGMKKTLSPKHSPGQIRCWIRVVCGLWDFKFLRRLVWKWLSSGMLHRVVW